MRDREAVRDRKTVRDRARPKVSVSKSDCVLINDAIEFSVFITLYTTLNSVYITQIYRLYIDTYIYISLDMYTDM